MEYTHHLTYKDLLRNSISPIIMMVFCSVYTFVDGIFLSNFVGTEPFAAVNLIMPYLMIFNATGFLFGVGGSALIGKLLGQKESDKANRVFTSIIFMSFLVGLIYCIICYFSIPSIAELLGAKGAMLEYGVNYGRVYAFGLPACLIQLEFQNLYSTAGKHKLGLYSTIISGITNIVLDAIFLIVLKWGVEGAALATIIAQYIGGLFPVIYFSLKSNTSFLKITPCKLEWKALGRVATNGSSEMVNNISISTAALLYNLQLMKYAGPSGVGAYGIMMYLNWLFTAIFWGYVVYVSPLISYQYGAKNTEELKSLFRKSVVILASFSLVMFIISESLSSTISTLFIGGDDEELRRFTLNGLMLYSINFIFAGLSIFSSAFFSALNNGLISAIISFTRVFIFQIPIVFLLPMGLGVNGIWLSCVIAEFLSMSFGLSLIYGYRKRYNY